MKIRTTPSRTSPLVRLEETMRLGEYATGWSANRLDRSTSAYLTQTKHSTGCRLAVSVLKLSSVKHEDDAQGLESVQSLHCNAKHSLDAARSSASASLSVAPRGGHPQVG